MYQFTMFFRGGFVSAVENISLDEVGHLLSETRHHVGGDPRWNITVAPFIPLGMPPLWRACGG